MGVVIGLDVGISTTKIVGIRDGRILSPICIKATDQMSSLYGAFGRYLHENALTLSDIEHVMLTGVGAGCISEDVYGLPTSKTDEFVADCYGANYESNLSKMIVVSMGTGTTIIKYDNGNVEHIGGLAMGGGTLAGLSRLLLGTDDTNHIVQLASNGKLQKIDLQIGDISKDEIPGLPAYATASLFGNADSKASKEDIALGILCTVIQTIGSAAILAAKSLNIKDFVMIGNISVLPQCRTVFSMMERLYGVRFHIPQHSEFATAIGSALNYFKK